MKKIVIAGAGHGGLTAAYNLAKNGYDVTVFEKSDRESLGYDWHDSINFDAFDESGIERPSSKLMKKSLPSGFENPSSTVKLKIAYDENSTSFFIDRKFLINYLIDKAEQVGVSFVFNSKIESALFGREKIEGLKIIQNGKTLCVNADMVIDACGMNSPVRSTLPPCFGIKNSFEAKESFFVYRAYYENLTGEVIDPQYLIGLFHMNKPGIDWIITEKDSVDILVGKFGSAGELSDEEIENSVQGYRELYPFVGEKILRGGQKGVIPLSKMLPLIVANGYAAVGDSAGMTIPLNGSGIVLSMRAGKILADKIIDAEGEPFSIENLWRYEYEYFQTLGKGLVVIDILKNFFTHCTGKQVDYFLEKRIITEQQLDFKSGLNITPSYILRVAAVALPLIKLLSPLVSNLKSIPSVDSCAAQMPETYDKKAVEEWIGKYSSL